jgi:4-hydroxybenzoate polyprenyltransferase
MHVNAIASGRISKKSGLLLNVVFVVVPLVLSWVFRWEVFLVCVVLFVWMWVYSSPPVRLKGRAGFDVVWHFFAFLLLVVWGLVVAGSVSLLGGLVAVSIGLWSVIGQIWNHIDDYRYDKMSGTMTFAVWAGLDRTKKVMKWSVFVHLVFLLPLVVLFSFTYWLSFGVLMVGLVVVVLVRPGTDFPLSRGYYMSFVFAGFVYLSCLLYHLLNLLGEAVLGWFLLFSVFGWSYFF